MPKPEIVSYINQCREKKIAEATIKKQLLASGWKESDIDEALASIQQPTPAAVWGAADAAGTVVSRHSRSRLILSLLGALVVFVAIGAWYFLYYNGGGFLKPTDQNSVTSTEQPKETDGVLITKPPTSSTENWTEYANEVGGYSLRYPKDFFHLLDGRKTANPVTATTQVVVVKKNNSSAGLFISINIIDTFSDFSALKTSLEESAVQKPNNIKVGRNLKVAGTPGVLVEECLAPTECRVSYFVFSNNRSIRISGDGKEKIENLSGPTREIFNTLSFKNVVSPKSNE